MSLMHMAGTLAPSQQQCGLIGLLCRGFLLPRSLCGVCAGNGGTLTALRESGMEATTSPSHRRFSVLSGQAGNRSCGFPTENLNKLPVAVRTVPCVSWFNSIKPSASRAPSPWGIPDKAHSRRLHGRHIYTPETPGRSLRLAQLLARLRALIRPENGR